MAAHAEGLIHRDIKPHPADFAYLVDFSDKDVLVTAAHNVDAVLRQTGDLTT